MNVGLENEAVQFHFWEYINQINSTVQLRLAEIHTQNHNTQFCAFLCNANPCLGLYLRQPPWSEPSVINLLVGSFFDHL